MSNEKYYVKMKKSGIYTICDYIPQDGVVITKGEYDEIVSPTSEQKRRAFLLGPSSTREKKAYLFLTLNCKITPGGGFKDIPGTTFYQGMTVDEMTAEASKYLGDDDDRAQLILEQKRLAKQYIRTFVEALDEAIRKDTI